MYKKEAVDVHTDPLLCWTLHTIAHKVLLLLTGILSAKLTTGLENEIHNYKVNAEISQLYTKIIKEKGGEHSLRSRSVL